MASRMIRKININLTEQSNTALETLVADSGMNQTDVINRALQLYRVWIDVVNAGGEWCQIQDGVARKITVLT